MISPYDGALVLNANALGHFGRAAPFALILRGRLSPKIHFSRGFFDLLHHLGRAPLRFSVGCLSAAALDGRLDDGFPGVKANVDLRFDQLRGARVIFVCRRNRLVVAMVDVARPVAE